MAENTFKPYIQIPNLSLALAIVATAMLAQLLFSTLFGNIIGTTWVNNSIGALLMTNLLQICTLYLFAQYLRNFSVRRLVTVFYIIIACIGLMTLAPLMSYALLGIFQASSIISFTSRLANLSIIILFFMAGFRLMRFDKDFVGGMNLLGKAFILEGITASITFIYYYYQLFTVIPMSTRDRLLKAPDLVTLVVSTMTLISTILIFICMINIYKRAIKYNNTVDRDEN
ncbi:MAG: hypothetical protein LBU84_18445 [Prevotella sp.]|nr:hypothetical protein [Prevotella sp.]